MSNWYVLQTKASKEYIAEQNLLNQGYTTFLPWVCSQRSLRGRLKSFREPLFPGYLFIELDLEQQNSAPIRSTVGVIGLVRFGATLPSFPKNIVEALITRQRSVNDCTETVFMFEPGDEVSVISGPLVGLQAIFKSRNSQERVLLLFDILGTEAQLLLSPQQIEKYSV